MIVTWVSWVVPPKKTRVRCYEIRSTTRTSGDIYANLWNERQPYHRICDYVSPLDNSLFLSLGRSNLQSTSAKQEYLASWSKKRTPIP